MADKDDNTVRVWVRTDADAPRATLSPEALARLDAITDKDIERAVAEDPDAPPMLGPDFWRSAEVAPAGQFGDWLARHAPTAESEDET